MAVKYLSEEWAKEVTNRFQSTEAVTNAAKGQNVTIQQIVTEAPGGDVKYYFKIADGTPEVAIGEIDSPEVTITQSYETSIAVDKGELNAQNAFMQGKLKIQGNLMKLMSMQGFFQTLPQAVGDLEREY